MKKEVRTVIYDDELRLEAYRFEGIMQPFQNHFHEYYVNGSVENGKRCLSCKNKEYTLQRGNIILFNPGDNHACVQGDDGTLDYRALNISKESMLNLIEEVTGKRELPGFSENVIFDEEVTCYLRPLHEMIMKGFDDLGKEENLLLLISLLIQRYGQPFEVSENTIKTVLPIFEKDLDLTEDERVVYKTLSKIMLKSISEIAPYVPFGKSKTTQLLKNMGKKGIITVEGNGRGTKYIIK